MPSEWCIRDFKIDWLVAQQSLYPFNSQNLIVNPLLYLLHLFLWICYKNFVLDQDKNFYLMSLSILITCLLDYMDILGRSCMWITSGSYLTLYTLTSVCIFSTLFFIHFLGCWQGEFVFQSKGFFPGDHFLYSHDLNVWFWSDIVGRS